MPRRHPPAPMVRPRRPRVLRIGALLVILAVTLGVGLQYLPGPALSRQGSPHWVGTGAGLGLPTPTAAPSRVAKPRPIPSQSAALRPLDVQPPKLTLQTAGVAEWAMLDRRTGRMYGSPGLARTNYAASVMKAWIAADYLRRTAAAGQQPPASRAAQLRSMIRDSDNDAAIDLYEVVGTLASAQRMIRLCRLSDGEPSGDWSLVRLSARDIARLGGCIASGRAAGARWTPWLLHEMRSVRGVGDFGVRDGFAAGERPSIAIKNGWVAREETGLYEVNCLAIGDRWTVGVVTRYPAELDYTYGAHICQKVGQELQP